MNPIFKRAAAAVAVAATLVLAGCTSWFGPPPVHTSSPTDESVSAELEPFYTQVLEWEPCGDGFGCTTAIAPLDWDDPAAGETELALVRHVATGDRIGSLLVNPGGPGGSGYDFVLDTLDYAVGERLQQRFDVVGFDPRGVGRSAGVTCYDAEGMDEFLYGIPEGERNSDEWFDDMAARQTAFGDACEQGTGALLAQVDTVSAARDLDLLRAVLGDEQLHYLGYSYGTFLGATYADLYPEKVGRLVLDGALDPEADYTEVSAAQYAGFEQSLRAYLENCLTGSECPFTGSVDAAMGEIGDLLASVDASPLRGTDGRFVGAGTLITAIIYPLYSPDAWGYLDDLFTSVQFGDADFALTLADAYNGRNADGTYADNSSEAFYAVNCLDYLPLDTLEAIHASADEIIAAAPIIGPYTVGPACAGWPVASEAVREPLHAEGADPILVVGTTGDPATPYQWAVNLSEQLDSGVLVTYDGEGHTAYNKSNRCVADAVENYLIDGVVPSADPKC
ncbi:alpha/beta hydrolase [Agromyces sp. LHK192]|uniref:alpha/beta hydrolase n=1 Tax=Agromyces sp. LHK192 TaxID=2498704 RepID=UPI000FD918F2|nr:alpha/beta hydrolase [Agromyces sp. LHK192]